MEMDALFILQISLELGFVGGSECVAFELHRTWQALGIDARAVTSHATEPEARQGISFVTPWLMHFGLRSRRRHLGTLLAVPVHARLREAGIATAEKYEWKKVAQQYLSLFDDLIAERAQNHGTLAGQDQWSGASQSLAAPNPRSFF